MTEREELLDWIVNLLKVSDDEILRTFLQRKLDTEFNEQISNVYFDEESSIQLDIRNEQVNIKMKDDKIVSVDKRLNLATEAIYIDDPFVLDEVSLIRVAYNSLNHRMHLKEKLCIERTVPNVVEEIITNSKFECIYNKVSSVCAGDVVKGKRNSLGYKVPCTNKLLEVKNLSTGLKTFAILKKLLVNGYLEYNGTIILDEPEIHLHPEWQLMFAELIVLLHREFGIHILLNTHSPYFLNAIEVYASKYGVDDKCKYYLAKNSEAVSVIEDVTDNIEVIYSKLAKPLQDLENERYRYDEP